MSSVVDPKPVGSGSFGKISEKKGDNQNLPTPWTRLKVFLLLILGYCFWLSFPSQTLTTKDNMSIEIVQKTLGFQKNCKFSQRCQRGGRWLTCLTVSLRSLATGSVSSPPSIFGRPISTTGPFWIEINQVMQVTKGHTIRIKKTPEYGSGSKPFLNTTWKFFVRFTQQNKSIERNA